MSAKKAKKCKRGHSLSGKNLYQRENGRRECKACSNLRIKKWRKQKATNG